MARGQRDRGKERHWRRHVAAWRRSGWSVRAYCESEGLSEASFYAWRRVLRERESCDAASHPRSGEAADNSLTAVAAVSPFVPVRLVDEAASSGGVEVVLRGGRVVRVAAGFAAQTLRAVVVALEELPC
jgi:hypothetical protein